MAGAAAVASNLARSLLFGVTPADPPTYLIKAVVMGSIAAVACVIPAWRAASIDRAVALRT